MRAAYYNEIDPYAAEWLRNLVARGLIAPGDVDERSIVHVSPDDLRGYAQCHFFAGIGGWSYALRRAGWWDERPVWTGSCPCQPFSTAGKQLGTADERHLWPHLLRLITECSPAVVFGEQVASKDGRGWLAGVRADLEALGYAVGAADLCAAGVGAPHIRQRLWWVGYAAGDEGTFGEFPRGEGTEHGGSRGRMGDASGAGLAERGSDGRIQREALGAQQGQAALGAGDAGGWWGVNCIPCADGKARRIEPGTFPLAHGVPNRVGRIRAYGNAIVPEVAEAFIRACVRDL